jgi:hypothetical protein
MTDNRFTDCDTWYEHYETLEGFDARLAFYYETFDKIDNILDSDLEDSIMDCIFDITGHYETEQDFEGYNAFAENVRQKQPAFYKEKYQYFANDLLYYYLRVGNDAKAKYYLDDFIENPLADIDLFLPINQLIALYGKEDWTLEVVEKCYDTLKNAEGYIGNVEDELGDLKMSLLVEKHYLLAKEKGTFEYDSFSKELAPYGFDFSNVRDLFIEAMEAENYRKVPLISQKSPFYYNQLGYLFCRYMKEELSMSFSKSHRIFFLLVKYWSKHNNGKSFKLNEDDYKEQLNREPGFLDNYFHQMYVGVVGLVYVYDFLYKIELIDEKVHTEAVELSYLLKQEVLKGSSFCWRYNGFLKHWTKPDSYTTEEYQEMLERVEEDFVAFDKNKKYEEHFTRFETKAEQKRKIEREKILNSYGKKSAKSKKSNNDFFIPTKTPPQPNAIVETLKEQRAKKVGRNEPCTCGSGRKYKNCCGK